MIQNGVALVRIGSVTGEVEEFYAVLFLGKWLEHRFRSFDEAANLLRARRGEIERKMA